MCLVFLFLIFYQGFVITEFFVVSSFDSWQPLCFGLFCWISLSLCRLFVAWTDVFTCRVAFVVSFLFLVVGGKHWLEMKGKQTKGEPVKCCRWKANKSGRSYLVAFVDRSKARFRNLIQPNGVSEFMRCAIRSLGLLLQRITWLVTIASDVLLFDLWSLVWRMSYSCIFRRTLRNVESLVVTLSFLALSTE